MRAGIERWNRDGSDTTSFHPEVERVATEGVYRGIAGIERFNADTAEVFDKFELRCEFEDLGDRTLIWGVVHVRARASGIETEIPMGGIVDLRDGRVIRFQDFGSKQAALEAAGMP